MDSFLRGGDTFSKAGEAMLLAEQGNREVGRSIAASLRGLLGSLRTWLAAMPTSLPPTEPACDADRLPTIG